MRERWQRLTARFEALGARERGLIFIASIVGLVLLFHELALHPLTVRQKQLAAQLSQARDTIRTTDGLIRTFEGRPDPDAVKRSYADALRKQLAEIDSRMQGLQRGLVPPERMAKLLEEMLARGGGVQLVSLRTLPVQRFEHPAGAPATAAPPAEKGAKPAASDRSIYQHSYEIALQGSYSDLHAYLARLEELPWQMFWGRITLDTESYPRLQMTLTIHTLSLSKAWLIV